MVAGAAVGSLAVDSGDRFSDLDLTFAIADHVPVADVLDDWTRALIDELDAVHLAALRAALAASVRVLMRAGAEARVPQTDTVAERLAELR